MSEEWIGYSVSLKAFDEIDRKYHSYQGVVVNLSEQEFTLSRVFRDGLPYRQKYLTLRLNDIDDMEIIEKVDLSTPDLWIYDMIPETPLDVPGTSGSCVPSGLVPNPFSLLNLNAENIKSNPVPDMPTTSKCLNVSKRSRRNKKGKDDPRNKLCFGGDVNDIKGTEFDFEQNLALFDKKTVFEEIDKSKGGTKVVAKKVIPVETDVNASCDVKHHVYQSDNGRNLVSVCQETHDKLLEIAANHGISLQIQSELISRATTELCLKLLALSYRSYCDPLHRSATVVLVCGMSSVGATGVCTARHLASHGVHTILFCKNAVNDLYSQELTLYHMTGQKCITTTEGLPDRGIDLVVIALRDESPQEINEDIFEWIRNIRASLVAIDPPLCGFNFNVNVSLVPAWPMPFKENNGKIHLCNLGIPSQMYSEAGIDFNYPFDAKTVVQLHRES